jgi:hypothetical protein
MSEFKWSLNESTIESTFSIDKILLFLLAFGVPGFGTAGKGSKSCLLFAQIGEKLFPLLESSFNFFKLGSDS